jgi:hypothetical protein
MPRTEAPDLSKLPPDALLSRREVAALSGFHPQTLVVWGASGRGPRRTVIEGRLRFRVADVKAWMGLEERAA